MGQSIGVCIVSRNRLLRESLSRILKKINAIRTLTGADLDPQMMEQIASFQPQVLLLDSMSGVSSAGAYTEEIRSSGIPLQIVLIGMEEDETTFLQAIGKGVAGYLPKEASANEVVAAVRAVVQGEAFCTPRLCRMLFDYVASHSTGWLNGRARIEIGLTRREQELIPLIARGLTNKEIAAHLNLSEQTVKNHIHRILSKVGAEDRLSALELCRERGLSV